MSSTATFKLEKTYEEALVDVTYTYEYEPEKWTLRDGSPGYPSSTDVEIEKVCTDACVLSIMGAYTMKELEDELIEKVVEYEQNKE